MAETRPCAQCGTMFVPRREHARFCGARCRAYQANLAGRAIAETFGRAAEFLNLAAADTPSITVTGAHAGR